MRDDLTVVILPGLDGTGVLSRDLLAMLATHSDAIVVDYPTDKFLNYDQLLAYVRSLLPQGKFVLVGESFSGPLALRLAAEAPPGLEGVVLGASFARLDLPLKKLLSFVTAMVSPRAVPISVLSFFLLGRFATAGSVQALGGMLAKVKSEVLTERARAALAVDLPFSGIKVDCPVLYLQAQHDRLIPRSAATVVAEICSNIRVETIDGPHFLFHAAPQASAASIRGFCNGLSLRKVRDFRD